MTGHLTSQQVTAYRSGVSGAEELLLLDDHLALCAECRSRVAELVAEDATSAIRMLRMDFSSAHFTEAQLDDFAARRPMPADLVQHLDSCPECRSDADDLRAFVDAAFVDANTETTAARKVTPVWLRPLAAAIAITALGLAAWLAIHANRQTGTEAKAPVQAAATIPPQFQAEVQAAMESGTLHVPASITGMTGAPVQLRSEAKPAASPAFHLVSPTATAVIDATPVFRWTPLKGATYSITVYDDHFHAVASAESLQATEWHPDKALPRGAAYLWEVRAVRNGHTERAPTATEPEARFAILSATDAQRLAEARAAMPDAPLALGILYADAGAIDDAKRELEQAASTADPKPKSTAEKLLDQLK